MDVLLQGGDSASVLDHRTVILNLTETNLHNTTRFSTEYSARSAYAMDDLSPQAWNGLVTRLQQDLDGELMKLVYQFFTKSSSNIDECDRTCRSQLINCNFKTARAQDTTFCPRLDTSIFI